MLPPQGFTVEEQLTFVAAKTFGSKIIAVWIPDMANISLLVITKNGIGMAGSYAGSFFAAGCSSFY